MSRTFGCFVLVAVAGVAVAIAVPQLARPRCVITNEHAAKNTLKTIAIAQQLYRENVERSGCVFGSTAALGSWGYFDSVLATGTKQGYSFEVAPSTKTPEFLWYVVARPTHRDAYDGRILYMNHNEVTYFLENTPENLAKTCDPETCGIPSQATPLHVK